MSHFPSGLQLICDEAKCVSLFGKVVDGLAVYCGSSALMGSSVAERMLGALAETEAEASWAAEAEVLELLVLNAEKVFVSMYSFEGFLWCGWAGMGRWLTAYAVTAYTGISPKASEPVETLDVQAAFDGFLPPAFALFDDVFAFFAFLQVPEVEL